MNIKIHYSFVIYIFILFFLGLLNYFLIFFVSVLIHEMAHALIGHFFELKINSIKIDICGISIKFDNINVSCIKKIIIYIAGPLINILLTIVIYYVFKGKYVFFALTNLGLFIFNMLPIYPLDGGKILYEIVNRFFYTKINMLKRFYLFFQIILLSILAYFCINFSNIQLFFLGIYFLRFTTQDKYKNIEFF